MQRFIIATFLLACIGSVRSFAASSSDYVEGELLVQFKPGRGRDANIHRQSKAPALRVKRNYFRLSEKLGRQVQLVADPSQSTAELIALFEADPAVEKVSPNYMKRLFALEAVPNDPSYHLQWALDNSGQSVNGSTGTPDADIDFPEARSLIVSTSPEVVVALIDSGIDYTHPDLMASMWTNAAEIAGNGLDDDLNGFVDDVYGYDFGGDDYIDAATGSITNDGPDNDPMDTFDHGTHCAGILAAVADNSLGVCGGGNVKIMNVKVAHNAEHLTTGAAIAAMEYVMMMKQRGVNVVAVNESYGGMPYNSIEEDVLRLLGDEGIVVCAAVGNSSVDVDVSSNYPSGYGLSNIIAVAATDSTDQLAGFSNRGATTVDLGAPGANILSTKPGHFGTDAMVFMGGQTYAAGGCWFSGTTPTNGVRGLLYDCGPGYPGDFPGEIAGNIALIERGELYYYEQVSNAMDAGASAVIIYNAAGETGIYRGTLDRPGHWIPAIAITRADGLALKSPAVQLVRVINRYNDSNGYRYLSGTSMAAPLVAGCIGTLAQHFPADDVDERVSRLLDNVDVVPALQGKCVTGGRLNLANALDSNGNQIPDCLESISITGVLSSPANQITFTWSSFDLVKYRVLGSTGLQSGDFLPVSGELSATPPENSWSISTVTNNTRFFRLEQIRE